MNIYLLSTDGFPIEHDRAGQVERLTGETPEEAIAQYKEMIGRPDYGFAIESYRTGIWRVTNEQRDLLGWMAEAVAPR